MCTSVSSAVFVSTAFSVGCVSSRLSFLCLVILLRSTLHADGHLEHSQGDPAVSRGIYATASTSPSTLVSSPVPMTLMFFFKSQVLFLITNRSSFLLCSVRLVSSRQAGVHCGGALRHCAGCTAVPACSLWLRCLLLFLSFSLLLKILPPLHSNMATQIQAHVPYVTHLDKPHSNCNFGHSSEFTRQTKTALCEILTTNNLGAVMLSCMRKIRNSTDDSFSVALVLQNSTVFDDTTQRKAIE